MARLRQLNVLPNSVLHQPAATNTFILSSVTDNKEELWGWARSLFNANQRSCWCWKLCCPKQMRSDQALLKKKAHFSHSESWALSLCCISCPANMSSSRLSVGEDKLQSKSCISKSREHLVPISLNKGLQLYCKFVQNCIEDIFANDLIFLWDNVTIKCGVKVCLNSQHFLVSPRQSG